MQRNRLCAVLAVALACAMGIPVQAAVAEEPAPASVPTQPAPAGTPRPMADVPLAERDEQQLFTDVPAPWRDYLLKARRAESLDDRLARCLAYPDLPGNAWPAGYGDAHCRYHLDDPLPLAEVARFVDAGDIAGLEQRIRTVFLRHGEPGGEGVHQVFGNFADTSAEGFDERLRIAERWVELAPESGYAALARAEVWRGRGWGVRGTAYVRDTPAAALREMQALHEKAVVEFGRAVSLQPDLIDAWIGLVDLVKAGSDDPVGAFAKARALDAGCGELAYRRMTNLLPRWGGSRGAMDAFASQLEPLVASRPLLANQQSSPFADYVDDVDDEQLYTPEVLDLLDEAVRLSGDEVSLAKAADVRMNIDGERRDLNRALAELLQVGRFKERSAWASGQLAWFLVRRDPTWALRLARQGVAKDPNSAWLHYLRGAAANNSRQFDEAQEHYLIAAVHADYSRAALRELSQMWLMDSELPPAEQAVRALPFIDRLLAEHPDDGRGLFMRMLARSAAASRRVVDDRDMEAFLAKADLSDPWQKRYYDEIKQAKAAATKRAAPEPAGLQPAKRR